MRAIALAHAIAWLWTVSFGAHASPSFGTVGLVPGQSTIFTPLIVAGATPDSPSARVDLNVPSSTYSGVVSINIRYNDPTTGNRLSFICSGAAINRHTVVTAAHCVDTNGFGHVIDLSQPGSDVRVVVNDDATFTPSTDLILASKVSMHPDYKGFGVCPSGVAGQCLNDDVAVLQLAQALPDSVQTYKLYEGAIATGSIFTMVGYGTTGNGHDGYLPNSADFFVKRVGTNVFDLFDTNDEADFSPSSAREVWYYDFDGIDPTGFDRDTFCDLGIVCGSSLGNLTETHIGPGDSGGPSFIEENGELFLAANNTFGGNFCWTNDNPCRDGDFGDIGGGILLQTYLSWIRESSLVIPEPGSLALTMAAAVALSIRRRRHRLVA